MIKEFLQRELCPAVIESCVVESPKALLSPYFHQLPSSPKLNSLPSTVTCVSNCGVTKMFDTLRHSEKASIDNDEATSFGESLTGSLVAYGG